MKTPHEITPVLTKHTLAERTELLVHRDKIRYSEAITHICQSLDLDPSDIVKLISPPLYAKIEAEAMAYNFISKRNKNTATLVYT